MKKLITSTLFCFFILTTNAQKFEWVKFLQTLGHGPNAARVATDTAGNVYILGTFTPMMTVDGDTITTTDVNSDMFLSKFNSTGMLQWSKTFGTRWIDDPRRIAVDDAGHIYVSIYQQMDTLFFEDTIVPVPINTYLLIQFDSTGHYLRFHNYPDNVSIHIATLGNDLYTCHYGEVTKHDTSFNVIWSRTINPAGAFAFTSYGYTGDLYVSDGGYLAVCGVEGVGGTIIFDTITMTFNGGFDDIGIILMDTSGSALWGKILPHISGVGLQTFACAVDNSGNVFWEAQMGTTLYFGSDTLYNPHPLNFSYAALLKYDAAGNEQWGVALTAVQCNCNINDIVINDQQEVIIAGDYWPGGNTGLFGGVTLPTGNSKAIVAKADQSGNVVWVKTDNAITNASSKAHAVTLMPPGNNYAVTGQYNDPQQYGCFWSPLQNGVFATLITENPEPVPFVDFTSTQNGNTVLFKDASQNATSLQWNFGDATTSTLAEPLHVYTQPGIYNACLTAANSCGISQKCETIEVKGVSEIVTNHGGNDAVVTADIIGGGFTAATTVLLKKSGNPDIVPYFIHFINSGKLEMRLDLTGQTLGAWDVEVTVPGDTVMTLINGFTIDSAEAYVFDVTFDGPSVARPLKWFPGRITVHNKSNKDAAGVVVIYRLDETWNSYITSAFADPQQNSFLNSGYQYLVANGLNSSLADHVFTDSASNSRFGAFVIPLLKANSSYTLPLFIRGTIVVVSSRAVSVSGTLLEPSSLTGTFTPSADVCFSDYFKSAVERSLAITISASEWNSCFPALYDSLLMVISNQAIDSGANTTPVSLPATLIAMLASMANSGCITGIPAILNEAEIKSVILKTLHNVVDSTELSLQIPICSYFSGLKKLELPPLPTINMSAEEVGLIILWCGIGAAGTAAYLCECPPVAVGAFVGVWAGCIIYTLSSDPNQISGPGNNDDDIFQKPGEFSSYTISFENADTATAPAQVVILTDTLDVSKFDVSTFRFTHVTIGDSLKFDFDEPGFSQVKVSSLAPFNTDYLRTEASFDSTSGIIKYILTTVDPINFQPDTNPLAGFLPPNVNGTEGTGHVSYEVQLKSSLVTGDSIKNKASIVFDTNAPIATNEWLNVIDIDKPQSSVNALPPNTNTTSFLVSWSGTDFVAGIKQYNIYVSENDQPYYLWLAGVDTNQYTFNGVNGNKYEFISIVMDNAGNVEDAPANPETNPDAVTTIISGINEIIGDLNFNLSPNPVNSELTIRSTELMTSIKVYDVVGNEIYNKQLQPTLNFKLQTSNFAQGIYSIEILSKNKKGLSKFIKMD